MTDDTPDAEELLQQSKTQKRHETDPADITVADEPTLVDAVADAYASDISENLTIRDGNLAALFAGLEETGELEAVIEAAADELDRDRDGTSKAEALRGWFESRSARWPQRRLKPVPKATSSSASHKTTSSETHF